MALNQKLAHIYAHELTRSEEQAKQAKISKFEPHLRRAFAKANDPKKNRALPLQSGSKEIYSRYKPQRTFGSNI